MKKNIKFILLFVLLFYAILLACFTMMDYHYKHLSLQHQKINSACVLAYIDQHDNEKDALLKLKAAKQIMVNNKKIKMIYSPFVVNHGKNSLKLLNKANIDKSLVLPDYYSTDMKSSVVEASKLMKKHHFNSCQVVLYDFEMKRYENYAKRNSAFDFDTTAVYINQKPYLNTEEGRKRAEKEIYALPKLWLNL